MVTVVLTGGGTGGHIYPALSIAEALRSLGAECLYIGHAGGLEAKVVPERGVPFEGVNAGARRRGLLGSFRYPASLARGTAEAYACLGRQGARAVVATGGYVCLPVAFAALARGIPVVLHEPNAVAGRANRLLARFAARVTLGFEESGRGFPPRKCVLTGIAVRTPEQTHSPDSARRAFGLEERRPTLLVAGGSQGAAALNRAVSLALDDLLELGLQVLHQTGTSHPNAGARAHYHALPYIEDMNLAYACADVAVTRAGASTLAELMYHALPALLVPYPFAADDHQRANANILRNADAARMMDQADLTPEALLETLAEMMEPAVQRSMKVKLATLARPDAARDIARLTLSLIS